MIHQNECEIIIIVKKLIYILIIIFTYKSIANAENKIDELFGVKLNSDISLYANVEDGKISQTITTKEAIYTFSNKSLTNIDREEMFPSYLIRTNQNYKIQVINAGIVYDFKDRTFSDFSCLKDKFYVAETMSTAFNFDTGKYKNFYRINIDDKRSTDLLWDDLNYIDNSSSGNNRLMIICSHRYVKGRIVSNLFLSWMTEDYYRKNVMARFKIIEPFDSGFIIQYLEK